MVRSPPRGSRLRRTAPARHRHPRPVSSATAAQTAPPSRSGVPRTPGARTPPCRGTPSPRGSTGWRGSHGRARGASVAPVTERHPVPELSTGGEPHRRRATGAGHRPTRPGSGARRPGRRERKTQCDPHEQRPERHVRAGHRRSARRTAAHGFGEQHGLNRAGRAGKGKAHAQSRHRPDHRRRPPPLRGALGGAREIRCARKYIPLLLADTTFAGRVPFELMAKTSTWKRTGEPARGRPCCTRITTS